MSINEEIKEKFSQTLHNFNAILIEVLNTICEHFHHIAARGKVWNI